MTLDLKIAFLLFFFGLWSFLGILPWLVVAIARRGHGALLALPLALAGGCAGGVVLPLLGADDARGFLVSLGTATAGGFAFSQIVFRLMRSPLEPSQEEKDGKSITVHHVGKGTV